MFVCWTHTEIGSLHLVHLHFVARTWLREGTIARSAAPELCQDPWDLSWVRAHDCWRVLADVCSMLRTGSACSLACAFGRWPTCPLANLPACPLAIWLPAVS